MGICLYFILSLKEVRGLIFRIQICTLLTLLKDIHFWLKVRFSVGHLFFSLYNIGNVSVKSNLSVFRIFICQV